MAGSSLAGVIFSVTLPNLYRNFSWFQANAIVASCVGGIGILALACVCCYDSVVPDEARTVPGQRYGKAKTDLKGLFTIKSLLKRRTWSNNSSYAWFVGGMFWLEVGICGISATIPFMADSLDDLNNHGPSVLMSLSIASLVSRIGAGYLADRVGHYETLVSSGMFTAVNLLVVGFWITHRGIPLLYYTAITWGLASGSWVTTFSGCIRILAPSKEYGKLVGECSICLMF